MRKVYNNFKDGEFFLGLGVCGWVGGVVWCWELGVE